MLYVDVVALSVCVCIIPSSAFCAQMMPASQTPSAASILYCGLYSLKTGYVLNLQFTAVFEAL
jgi:hypothetical protein